MVGTTLPARQLVTDSRSGLGKHVNKWLRRLPTTPLPVMLEDLVVNGLFDVRYRLPQIRRCPNMACVDGTTEAERKHL